MIDAEMIKGRLGRLLKPAAKPTNPAEGDRAGVAPAAWTWSLPGNPGGQVENLGRLDPSPGEIAELLAIPNTETFVERSYLRILGRSPELRGGTKHARLLKFSPLHTRNRFLQKLLRSEERWWHCRTMLESLARQQAEERRVLLDGMREVDERRAAVQAKLKDAEVHRRLLDEQARLLEAMVKSSQRQDLAVAEQKKLLEAHKPIPGLHVRLLEQYRERFQAIETIVEVKHGELDDQREVFAIQSDEFARHLLDFASQREDLARQREDLARQCGELSAQREDLARQCADFSAQREDFARQREDLGLKREQFERQFAIQASLADHLTRYLEQFQHVIEVVRHVPDAHVRLIEQIRVVPQLHAELLGEQRRVFDRQEREGDRRIDQVEALVRGLVDAWDRAEVLPMTTSPPGALPARNPDPTDPYLAEVELFVHESYRLLLRRPPESGELAEESERLRSSVGRLKGEFLQSLLARQSPSAAQETAAIDAVRPEAAKCRICEGELTYKWSHKVVRNRYVGHYYECVSCHALQVVDPSWLPEAYADEGNPRAENPDKGRFARNFSAFHYISAMVESGLVPERPMTLDFGGGYGLLTQMLRSGGYEAWQADPHVPVPFLAADRGLSRLEDFPDGSFDLVTSLEVMEHLDDPQSVVDRLARLLKPTGLLMLSTTIYHPGEHDQNWFYLGPEVGQHITFWTRDALAECARRAGFRSIGFYPGDDGFFILFAHLSAEQLSARIRTSLEAVRDGRLLARITLPWDLQSMGYVRVLDEPVVIALENAPHQLAALSGRGAA